MGCGQLVLVLRAGSGNAHFGIEGGHGTLGGILSLSGAAVAGRDGVLGAGGSRVEGGGGTGRVELEASV